MTIYIPSFLPPSPLPLTVMAWGDVHTLTGGVFGAQLRYPVERLDSEGVCGVRQQAPHLHPTTEQAVLCGPVADAVSTGQARSLRWPAHGALDRVAQVCSSATVQGLVPLQGERGVIDLWDDAARGRGRSCSEGK